MVNGICTAVREGFVCVSLLIRYVYSMPISPAFYHVSHRNLRRPTGILRSRISTVIFIHEIA